MFFLELSCFFDDPADVGNLISGSSAFFKTSLNVKFTVHVLLKPGLENFEHYSKKDVLFIIGDWNAKLGSQETPGITGTFGLRVWNEAGQRLIEFCQENALVIANTLFQQHKEDSTHGHHQMVNTEMRFIIFFAAKDGEAPYSRQKQDRELTVAQIMNSLLPNSH